MEEGDAALSYNQPYRDPDLSRQMVGRIREVEKRLRGRPVRIMEVCGTHTAAIFRSGIRSLLPPSIRLISGPGCPVCVTDQNEIDACLDLAARPDVILATFGDLMRVPGTATSLQRLKAEGRDIRIIYSAADILELAARHPDQKVVLAGVGFETTAPTVGAAILAARRAGLSNCFVLAFHKRVPPALEVLMNIPDVDIDAFLLPGHVSVIIGEQGYGNFFQNHPMPGVITGFEPADILQGIVQALEMIEARQPGLVNCYPRAVRPEGNPIARAVMDQVFDAVDAAWRGIGTIPGSGLALKEEFKAFDALKHFDIRLATVSSPAGCACGDILIGRLTPPECRLYKKTCTPAHPVGPCMVSSEGTCAAYYKYYRS
jgi:hydrogenase expression/formation protein HypD